MTTGPRGSHPSGASAFRRRVLALIRRIPRGRVATYGQIASLAGAPRNARRVGRVLATLPPGSGVPWQRVINAQGGISQRAPHPLRALGGPELAQAALLRREGVRLKNERVDLARYRWRPRAWRGA